MSQTPGSPAAQRQVDFGEAVRLYFANYANFRGRSSRGAYWWSVLFYWLVMSTAAILQDNAAGGVELTALVWIGLLLPNIAVTMRRLHDIGMSGWWWILLQVPILGFIFSLIWLTKPGRRGPNDYGPDREEGRDPTTEVHE
jgi:uncharacterized membrane protein YhaH (DUF805 family)